MADQSNQNKPDGVVAPSMLTRVHRALRAFDQVFRAMDRFVHATRNVEPVTKAFNFVTHEALKPIEHRLEMSEAIGAERTSQASRLSSSVDVREARALNQITRLNQPAVATPRLDAIGSRGVRAAALPMGSATTSRALLPEGLNVQMNGALLADRGVAAARSASRVSARGSDAISPGAEKLSVGINLDSIDHGLRPGDSTRRSDAIGAIAKTHNTISRTLGTASIAESRARAPEFAAPVRDSARQTTSSAARGAVTINSSPTVVIHASDSGANLEQQVTDALRKYREDMFDQLTREAARRERAEY